jgi:quinol monooxygenase YgiN
MQFTPDSKATFIDIFYKKQPFIEGFEGCHSVDLMEDEADDMVLYTFSKWDENESLQKYRNSEMFIKTWKQVKPLFASKAQTFSLLKHEV